MSQHACMIGERRMANGEFSTYSRFRKVRHDLKKKELIFIAVILLLAVLLWGGMQITKNRSSATIRITVDGKEYGIYSLNKDQTIHIGDTNVCEIKNGLATMTDASCPDHLCMYQGSIGEKGGLIVCLPNKVVIEGVKAVSSDQVSDGVDTVS